MSLPSPFAAVAENVCVCPKYENSEKSLSKESLSLSLSFEKGSSTCEVLVELFEVLDDDILL